MGDWLTIIIVLLILGILLDGWRRMRRAHREALKVSPALRKVQGTSGPEPTGTEGYSAELPNGGARVAYREQADAPEASAREARNATSGQTSDKPPSRESAARPKTPHSRREGQIPEQVTLNLDESVPILMETTGENAIQDEASNKGRIEPTLGEVEEPPLQKRNNTGQNIPGQASSPEPSGPGAKVSEARGSKAPPADTPAKPPEEVLIINIMAPGGQVFRGDALLDALLQGGLRFGDMNIFHRYEKAGGGGAILFSLANMVKPGTFDLDQMDDFTTPGVSLFMTLPLEATDSTNTQVFELMLETAQNLAHELGGELKDENRSVMTRQTMEHCRQRIHEFERKQLFRSGA